jgi:Transposase DDE domain
VIFADALPRIKTFLRPARLTAATTTLLVRLVAAFLCHRGRLGASQAAGAIRSQARHRAQLTRFLARLHWSRDWAVLATVADLLLQHEARRAGTWAFLLDQTYVGQQGQKTENTFSRANYRSRAKKGHRKQKKHAQRSCHGFVCGLLLTPSGLRIPCCRAYYTEGYCQAKRLPYRKQTELAAELIRQLAVPAGAQVVVLGDTAFEAAAIRAACAERGWAWVVPLNPERVLAGPKPRPKVLSLVATLSADRFEAVRLVPGQGPLAAQRRAARCRVGPQAKARTYYVHPERHAVHNVGDVLLVFSTKAKPKAGAPVRVQKVLLTNAVSWTAARVVELYDLRWQIELFFKELKGTLGLHCYRFRQFAKVENWAQACLVAFCYLEWYRAEQLRRRDLPEERKQWWRWQRSYGLSLAVGQATEEHDLARLHRLAGTPTGRRKLRKCLREALPREYRPAG